MRRATLIQCFPDWQKDYFYPRSPCGERLIGPPSAMSSSGFLSTLSLRRATAGVFLCYLDNIISIHALLAESDVRLYRFSLIPLVFLSTLSLRRATVKKAITFHPPVISIHALLAESDFKLFAKRLSDTLFLSTLSLRRATYCCSCTPHSRRFLSTLSLRRATRYTVNFHAKAGFLSTLSLRRATARRASRQQPAGISIHALLAESDQYQWFCYHFGCYFYPRSPCGERP